MIGWDIGSRKALSKVVDGVCSSFAFDGVTVVYATVFDAKRCELSVVEYTVNS